MPETVTLRPDSVFGTHREVAGPGHDPTFIDRIKAEENERTLGELLEDAKKNPIAKRGKPISPENVN